MSSSSLLARERVDIQKLNKAADQILLEQQQQQQQQHQRLTELRHEERRERRNSRRELYLIHRNHQEPMTLHK